MTNKIQEIIQSIKAVDQSKSHEIQNALDNLTKPRGSLGNLEEVAKKYCLITGRLKPARTAVPGMSAVAEMSATPATAAMSAMPAIRNKTIITMAADHGVAREGVSAYPQEVTRQMVINFLQGGAGINVLARHVGARVIVVDMGVAFDFESFDLESLGLESLSGLVRKKVAYGTKNMLLGPAMSREEAFLSIERGMEVVEENWGQGIDLLGIGEMGIGNTTASSAILSAITGQPPERVTGRGTGIDEDRYQQKIAVIRQALQKNAPNPDDPLDVLSKVGGFEIGGLTGVILSAAARHVPVVIDGFISSAAALIAVKMAPAIVDYLFAAHRSVEVGHQLMLEYMGLTPLLDLRLRLGEGTGAALAMNIIEAGVKILNEMATFDQAHVSREE